MIALARSPAAATLLNLGLLVGWPKLTELVVRDPWPENLGLRRLSGEDIRNTFILIKVTVQG